MTTCRLRQSILLATVLAACLALALALPAYAAESSATSDVWSPSVTVTTDKASYAAGERIAVTATAENDLDEHAQKTAPGDEGARAEDLGELAADLDVAIAVPDGYAVVEGSARASAAGVMPGEKVTARAVLAKQVGAPAAGTSPKTASSSASGTLPKTGDASWALALAALATASAVILIIAALKLRGRKGVGSHTLSCLLALVLVAGLVPWAPGSAHAAEEDAAHPEHVGRGSATFAVDGKSVTVTAAVVAEHGENASGFDEIPDSYGQTSPVATEDKTPLVEVVITDAQVQAAGTGSYDVITTMKVRIHQGEGTVDLNAGAVTLEEAYNAKTEARDRAYPGTIVVTGADTITATQSLAVGGDADLVWDDASPQSELIWQAVSELKSHAVVVGGDAVKDADGNAVEVPALRPYVDREQNANTASAQSLAPQTANGPANLTTQADTSDETASKSLEAADKLLEAIGQFVDAALKEDAGEAIQGAGSILGIIAKGITIVSGATGPSYDLIDVVERLDSISADVKDLTSQVGQVSAQLDSIKQQTEFTMTGNEVADLVATGLRYKDFVTSATKQLERTDAISKSTDATSQGEGGDADIATQVKKQFDSLSDNDKATLKSLASQLKYAASAYGASAYETAIHLADKATDTTWGMDNIYKAYAKYVGSYLNWEPETYEPVGAYTAELILAFNYAYTAAMNELNVEIATSDDASVVAGDVILRKQLLDAADKFIAVSESDEVKALMESRSDGKVRNLVTGTLFEPYTDNSNPGLLVHAFTSRNDLAPSGRVYSWIPRDFDLDDSGKFPIQRYESAISRGQFEEMFDRLKAVRTVDNYGDAASLKAEMQTVGLLPSEYSPDGFDSTTNWDEYDCYKSGLWFYRFSKNSVSTEADKSQPLKIRQEAQSSDYFYVASDDSARKVKDKQSAEHIRDITGTAVNIAAQSKGDLVKEGLVLYRLDEKYITCHGWRLYVTYHPLAVAVSSGQ